MIPGSCCARAASGHAAAPTSKVMRSRRLMGLTAKYSRSRACQWRASQQKAVPHVRFGSKAYIAPYLDFVRFTPESGQTGGGSTCPLCAKSGHNAVQQISAGLSSLIEMFG